MVVRVKRVPFSNHFSYTVTDRETGTALNPTELDWILGIAVRWNDMELAFYREEDRPLDQSGLVQKYYALQLRFAFDVSKGALERIGLKR